MVAVKPSYSVISLYESHLWSNTGKFQSHRTRTLLALKMRFRPLCIDYHAEAAQILRESKSGTKRPVIWLSLPAETEQAKAGLSDDQVGDVNPRTSNNDIKTIRRCHHRTKRQRCGPPSPINKHAEEESFTAVFEPPSSYTNWVEDWSVSEICDHD